MKLYLMMLAVIVFVAPVMAQQTKDPSGDCEVESTGKHINAQTGTFYCTPSSPGSNTGTWQKTIQMTVLGCVGIAAKDTAALLAAAASAIDIQFPSSNCVINNSAGPIVINGFHRKITQAAGGLVTFSTINLPGIELNNCDNSFWTNIKFVYAGTNTVRYPESVLNFFNSADVTVDHLTYIFDGSPGGALAFTSSLRPHISNVTFLNTIADGLTMANSAGNINGVICDTTGDDCAAISSFNASGPQALGTVITNVYSKDSGASRVDIAGGSIVAGSNITCINSKAPGGAITILQDGASDPSYEPGNVSFTNVEIYNAGQSGSGQRTAVLRPHQRYLRRYKQHLHSVDKRYLYS